MNILITGCAGFIGFSLTKKLLANDKNNIFGLDNLNTYYSIKLKKKRLSILKKYKKFKFFKYDLIHKKKLDKLFKDYKFDIIFHLAAQAGVRYVLTNPEKFVESNIVGFDNLLNASKKSKYIKKFFYASSSSVYGELNKYPVKENNFLRPKNIYGLSKKFNEDLVKLNQSNKTRYIGLRLFTVYGEWGRPDMLILKLLKHAEQKKVFYLNGNGNYWRDFTYINDVVDIIFKLSKTNFKQDQIYNICNSKPVHIGKLVKMLSKKINFNKIVSSRKNNIEVFKTHGCNKKVLKLINKKNFHNCFDQLDKIINWHNKYKHLI